MDLDPFNVHGNLFFFGGPNHGLLESLMDARIRWPAFACRASLPVGPLYASSFVLTQVEVESAEVEGPC